MVVSKRNRGSNLNLIYSCKGLNYETAKNIGKAQSINLSIRQNWYCYKIKIFRILKSLIKARLRPILQSMVTQPSSTVNS